MNLKKIGKVFTSKFVGTVPLSYKKRIYWAAVSQRLRNTDLMHRHSEGFLCFQNIRSLQGYKSKLIIIYVYKESNCLPCVKLTKFTQVQQQHVQVVHTEFHPVRTNKMNINHSNILTPVKNL